MNYKSIILMFLFFLIWKGIQAQSNQVDTTYLDSLIEVTETDGISEHVFNDAMELLRLSKQIDYEYGIISALIDIGYYYNTIGLYTKAINTYQELYDYAQSKDDSEQVVNAYLGLGDVYSTIELYKEADEYYKQSKTLATEMRDFENLINIYNNIGFSKIERRDFSGALEDLFKAKNLLKEIDPKKIDPVVEGNIGLAYAKMGRPNQAIPYMNDYFNVIKEIQDSLSFYETYRNLAIAYQQIYSLEDAFMYYDTSLYYSNLFNQDEATSKTYLEISDAYLARNDYRNALDYFRKYQQLRDSVINFRLKLHINELEVGFETEQKERTLLAKQKEVDELVIARQRMGLLIGGLLGSLAIMLLIFFKIRGDHRRKLKLKETKETLTRTQLENKKLEANQLQHQLESKEADLTNLALDIARKNEFSQQLIDQLETLQKSKPENLKFKLKDTIHFVSNHLRVSEDLALLQDNIDRINQSFHEKLDAQFPKLTANDKYMLGLIRLNLSNKDIATIKGISTNSAKVTRYRLRKKLQLTPEIDFAKFLQNF